jgi:protein disulfide-isomerase A6
MGVSGFPTLKLVKPGPRSGRPIVEDYQGARTAKAIVEAVVERIPNHVKRVTDTQLDQWLSENPETPKAMLFSEKGTTSALIKALAVDFLGVVNFAQIRSKETNAVEKYGVTKFPTLVVLPGPGKDPLLYADEMKKTPILAFISQVATPNPDPAPKQAKPSSRSKAAKSAASSFTASSKFSKASAAHKSADLYEDIGEIVLDDSLPTGSPLPVVPPKATPISLDEVVPAIPVLATPGEVTAACLGPKSGTCILVLLPKKGSEDALSLPAAEALASFAELAEKAKRRKATMFPFYEIAPGAEGALRGDLDLGDENQLAIVAINMKRGWYRVYASEAYDYSAVESFIDGIRLGEGSKQKLPEGFPTANTEVIEDQPEASEPVSTVEHKEL